MTGDKAFADNIIEHNGYFDGDDDNTFGDNPRAIKIVEYLSTWNILLYGITCEGENQDKYTVESEFVRNPRVIWTYTN